MFRVKVKSDHLFSIIGAFKFRPNNLPNLFLVLLCKSRQCSDCLRIDWAEVDLKLRHEVGHDTL